MLRRVDSPLAEGQNHGTTSENHERAAGDHRALSGVAGRERLPRRFGGDGARTNGAQPGATRLSRLPGQVARRISSCRNRREGADQAQMTTGPSVLMSRCMRCGADLPPWFDPAVKIYDVAADDAAYAAWLDTPCRECGS